MRRVVLVVLWGMLVVLLLGVLVIGIGPRIAPYQTFVVLSGSMEPAISTDSIVIVRPVPAEQVEVGDVITYWPRSRTPANGPAVTHRVIEIIEPGKAPVVITKGDANTSQDAAEVQLQDIAWKVALPVPYAGYALAWAQSRTGQQFLPLTAAAVLMLWWGYDRFRARQRTASETPPAAE